MVSKKDIGFVAAGGLAGATVLPYLLQKVQESKGPMWSAPSEVWKNWDVGGAVGIGAAMAGVGAYSLLRGSAIPHQISLLMFSAGIPCFGIGLAKGIIAEQGSVSPLRASASVRNYSTGPRLATTRVAATRRSPSTLVTNGAINI